MISQVANKVTGNILKLETFEIYIKKMVGKIKKHVFFIMSNSKINS